MYYGGKGVPQDYNKAMSWYRKAAEKGYAGAMLNMGVIYAKGKGVPQDYAEAYVWFSVASAFGNKSAEELRDAAAGQLTTSVKLAAQSQASELFKKIQKNMAE